MGTIWDCHCGEWYKWAQLIIGSDGMHWDILPDRSRLCTPLRCSICSFVWGIREVASQLPIPWLSGNALNKCPGCCIAGSVGYHTLKEILGDQHLPETMQSLSIMSINGNAQICGWNDQVTLGDLISSASMPHLCFFPLLPALPSTISSPSCLSSSLSSSVDMPTCSSCS